MEIIQRRKGKKLRNCRRSKFSRTTKRHSKGDNDRDCQTATTQHSQRIRDRGRSTIASFSVFSLCSLNTVPSIYTCAAPSLLVTQRRVIRTFLSRCQSHSSTAPPPLSVPIAPCASTAVPSFFHRQHYHHEVLQLSLGPRGQRRPGLGQPHRHARREAAPLPAQNCCVCTCFPAVHLLAPPPISLLLSLMRPVPMPPTSTTSICPLTAMAPSASSAPGSNQDRAAPCCPSPPR